MSKRGKKLLLLAIVLAIGAGGLGLTAMSGGPTPKEILTQTAETLKAAQDGHAMLELALQTTEKQVQGMAEAWGKKLPEEEPQAPPAFRVEVREASEAEAQGAVAVSDGEQLWVYLPARNTVWVGQVDEMRQHEGEPPFESAEGAIEWLLEVSEVTLLGSEEVAGQLAYKFQLVPRPEALPEAAVAGGAGTLWIDLTRWVPLQALYSGGAMGEGRVTVRSLELDVGLPDDLFHFEIPEGAEVVPLEDLQPRHLTLEEAEATYDLLTPGYVPEGAVLIDVQEVRGTIVLRYESAQGSFAVSQGADGETAKLPPAKGESVSVRGATGTLFTSEAETKVFLVWTEGELTFTVSGSIPAEEALSIAESLR